MKDMNTAKELLIYVIADVCTLRQGRLTGEFTRLDVISTVRETLHEFTGLDATDDDCDEVIDG